MLLLLFITEYQWIENSLAQNLTALDYLINMYIKYTKIYTYVCVYTYYILCIGIKAFGTPSQIILVTAAG